MLKIREAVVKYRTKGRPPKVCLNQPHEVYGFFKRMVDGATRELFFCVYLTGSNRVLCFEQVAVGTSMNAVIDCKAIVRTALLVGAESVILVHNHPSGECIPSSADKEVTARVKLVCKPFDINVLDHLVIGEGQFTSFKQTGVL